jgi:hypothetical protein
MGINLNQPYYCGICNKPTHKVYARWVSCITCSPDCNKAQIARYEEKLRERKSQSQPTATEEKGTGGS